MSASERLKALSVSRAIDWPAPSYEAYRMAEDAERLRKNAIERALPELLAVLKSAEAIYGGFSMLLLDEDSEVAELGRRLAALTAKLTTKGER